MFLILSGAGCSAWMIYVYWNPSATSTAIIDHFSGKAIVSFLGAIFVFLAGLVLLRLVYLPTIRRFICNMAIFVVGGAGALAGIPISLSAAEANVTYTDDGLPTVLVKFADSNTDVATIYGFLVFGLVMLTLFYLLSAHLKLDDDPVA